MSENSYNFPEKNSEKSQNILAGSGISFAQVPRSLFKLKQQEGITAGDAWLALCLFDWCHDKRKFPEFEISYAEIVKVSAVARRQVVYSVQKLIDLRLLSARLVKERGELPRIIYKWNEYLLKTGEYTIAKNAPVLVQEMHQSSAENAPILVQEMHPIYIEFILDYIYNFYRDYFASNSSLVKRVPKKRGQNGEPQSSGSYLYISRKDAWKEAIEAVQPKSGWVRIYVALAGGFNIDNVNHPTSYLRKVVWDESHQWESKKKSHLYNQGHLDSDEAFLKFILAKRGN
jgi:hypothetical protein